MHLGETQPTPLLQISYTFTVAETRLQFISALLLARFLLSKDYSSISQAGLPAAAVLNNEHTNGLIFPFVKDFIVFPMVNMVSRFSRVQLCATLLMAAHQPPLSTGFSRQEYWSGLPFINIKTSNIFILYSLKIHHYGVDSKRLILLTKIYAIYAIFFN